MDEQTKDRMGIYERMTRLETNMTWVVKQQYVLLGTQMSMIVGILMIFIRVSYQHIVAGKTYKSLRNITKYRRGNFPSVNTGFRLVKHNNPDITRIIGGKISGE